MTEFEKSLDSLGEGGLISGMMGVAKEAAGLATAGDALDEAIECPGT